MRPPPAPPRRLPLIAAFAALVVASACSVEADSGWPATTEVPTAAEVTGEPAHLIEVVADTRELPRVTVAAGETVTWQVDRSADRDHWFVSDGPGGIESATLQPGNSYSHRFDEPGTFEYFCRIHPELRGTVVVTEQGRALGPPPDGRGREALAGDTVGRVPPSPTDAGSRSRAPAS